jgi:hypothetical protein
MVWPPKAGPALAPTFSGAGLSAIRLLARVGEFKFQVEIDDSLHV